MHPEPGRACWRAFGTLVDLRLRRVVAVEEARAEIERELDAIDLACSRFRADSELARVNREAGAVSRVGPLLAEAIAVSLRGAELTDGAVDPTVGGDLIRAGYDRDWRAITRVADSPFNGLVRACARPPRAAQREGAGWRGVMLDRRAGLVRIPPGVSLDLGATCKAWAADRAAAIAGEISGGGALVSIGGDLALAGEAPAGGWRVLVGDSSWGGGGQTIGVPTGALATSGTTVRRWRHDGERMHHIIDTRSGRPARSRWRTVSVAAENCVDANIAATATLASRYGSSWLAGTDLAARLVAHGGDVTVLGGWPAEG
ncbi:MAG TPA: FAD:protein FMN transferase [Solirubrobacteraceae bacterium]